MIRRLVRMTILQLLCGIFIAGTLSFAWAQAGPPKFKLKVAHTFVAGALAPTWAAAEGGYEAGTAIFKSPESAERILKTTLKLIEKVDSASRSGPKN